MAFFSFVKEYQRYKKKFAQRKVVLGRRAFRTDGMIANSDDFQADLPNSGGLITSTVRGVEIRLSPESICRIFDISSVELWMYESKAWPTVLGFESTTLVLPYDYFLTRVFKDVGVDLSREIDFEAFTIYDTYDEQPLGQMKFEKAPNGSWIRRVERPLAQARG
uniref:Uncharacterized protein n=1 Tax=Vitis vinifera TaxID=29760 RepID=A5AZW6_VITVI|nr:hypothetical protein VITISV_004657 [Vitis vinifera]